MLSQLSETDSVSSPESESELLCCGLPVPTRQEFIEHYRLHHYASNEVESDPSETAVLEELLLPLSDKANSELFSHSITSPNLALPSEKQLLPENFSLNLRKGLIDSRHHIMIQPLPSGLLPPYNLSQRAEYKNPDCIMSVPNNLYRQANTTYQVPHPIMPRHPTPNILLSKNSIGLSLNTSTSDPLDFTTYCNQAGCNKKFKTQRGLTMHLAKGKCPANSASYEDKPFKCDLESCSLTFKSLKGLRYHKVHHHNLNSLPFDSLVGNQLNLNITGPPPALDHSIPAVADKEEIGIKPHQSILGTKFTSFQ